MSLEKLVREQEKKSKLVRRYDDISHDKSVITGVDVSYSGKKAVGCAVVADVTTLKVIDTSILSKEIEADYIPGFFQLREGPIILELLRDLERIGIVLIDGNGILHPRRFGLASYIGLKLDIPTVGVAKSLMIGDIGPRQGDIADIVDNGDVIGKALWLGKRKPIYVSIGHRVSLETAVKVVRDSCVDDYPSVLYRAHIKSKEELKRLLH